MAERADEGQQKKTRAAAVEILQRRPRERRRRRPSVTKQHNTQRFGFRNFKSQQDYYGKALKYAGDLQAKLTKKDEL